MFNIFSQHVRIFEIQMLKLNIRKQAVQNVDGVDFFLDGMGTFSGGGVGIFSSRGVTKRQQFAV